MNKVLDGKCHSPTLDEQRKQVEKMEAIGLMAGKMAHDFNNVLMIIGGSLEILEDRIPHDPKTAHFLATATQGVARGAMLAQQLLAFARPQHERADIIEVDSLLSTMCEQLRTELGSHYSVQCLTESPAAHCRLAEDEFRSAVVNLTDNARDAMPDGGVLALSAANATIDKDTAAANSVVPGDYIVVSVTDSGHGIEADQLSKVVEPFFSSKHEQGRAGFGLSQVYSFARHSGGFIAIESTLGLGTTVTVYLPAYTLP